MRTSLLLLLLSNVSCLIDLCIAAAADGPKPGDAAKPPDSSRIFIRIDADQDGVVTEQEYVAHSIFKDDTEKARTMFKRADKDGNGKMTKDELAAFMGNRGGGERRQGNRVGKGKAPAPERGDTQHPDPDAGFKRIFKRLDQDADGMVTEQEYVARSRWKDKDKARKIWRASDGNGDGKVTAQEYCENRRVTDKAKEVFKWLDKNRDGKVTEEEVGERAKEIFAEMDKNGNGEVNIPEFLRTRWEWEVKVQWQEKRAEN